MSLFFGLVILKSFYKDEDDDIQVGADNQFKAVVPTQGSASNSSSQYIQDTNLQSTITPSSQKNGKYKSGSFIGTSEDAYYGYIKVKVVILDGKISDVVFLDHPGDNRTSEYINSQAMPLLKAEAISKQSANVDIISGASDTSMAFIKSLERALNQAI